MTDESTSEKLMGHIRTINPRKCPHLILALEHYRTDGSCRCDDVEHKVMVEWGYLWDGQRWESPNEEDDDESSTKLNSQG